MMKFEVKRVNDFKDGGSHLGIQEESGEFPEFFPDTLAWTFVITQQKLLSIISAISFQNSAKWTALRASYRVYTYSSRYYYKSLRKIEGIK